MKWLLLLLTLSGTVNKVWIDNYVEQRYTDFDRKQPVVYVVNNKPVAADKLNEVLKYWIRETINNITAIGTENGWFIFITGTIDINKRNKNNFKNEQSK